MVLHANMIPFFIITILICTLYMLYVLNKIQRPLGLSLVVGAGAGLIGPMLFMLPLRSCTFEPDRSTLDMSFGVLLFLLGALLLLWPAQWLTRFWGDKENRPSLTSGQTTLGTFNTNLLVPALLLAPTIFILALFLYFPLIETFRLSTLLVRLGAPRTRFECVSNFTAFFDPNGFDLMAFALVAGLVAAFFVYQFLKRRGYDFGATVVFIVALGLIGVFFARIVEPDYGEVLFNTFFISTTIVIFGLIIGLAIALLAYQPVTGAHIYRTLLIWPYAVSPAISGLIFFMLFNPSAGIINHFIQLMGGDKQQWLTNAWLARFVIIIASVWKTLGYNVLFYIAGLQTVPKSLLEAATIDGANAWQRFRNVTIPALSPITFFLIITNLTYSFFNIFGTIDYLTKGGPAGATSVSIYEIIQLGIRSKDLGRASAQSIVLFILVIGVTWFQFRTSGRRVTYGA